MRFHVLDQSQNNLLDLASFFAPSSSVPLKIFQGQLLHGIYSYESGFFFFLIESGQKFYLQLHRFTLIGPFELQNLVNFILNFFTRCTTLQIDKSFICDVDQKYEVLNGGHSFVLKLGDSLDEYLDAIIDAPFRRDIDRRHRNLQKISNAEVIIKCSQEFEFDEFLAVCKFIRHNLFIRNIDISESINTDDNNLMLRLFMMHKIRGGIAYIKDGDELLSAALLIRNYTELSYSHSAFNEKFSKYSPSKILLYSIIKFAYDGCYKSINLGGGDFGYKTSFGALNKEYYNLLIHRS
jgi:hypothetical protein